MVHAQASGWWQYDTTSVEPVSPEIAAIIPRYHVICLTDEVNVDLQWSRTPATCHPDRSKIIRTADDLAEWRDLAFPDEKKDFRFLTDLTSLHRHDFRFRDFDACCINGHEAQGVTAGRQGQARAQLIGAAVTDYSFPVHP